MSESILVNGILYNFESWHNLTQHNISELENVYRMFLQNQLKAATSTPIDGCYLELGIMQIRFIIKAKRLNYYLYYSAIKEQNSMLYRVFNFQ